MSVQPGPTFKRYAANGVATVYTIPFLLLDAADLQITLNGTLVTTGFTLSGIGNPQSTCTFTAAPTGDLLFQQVVPFQRLADYQNNGDFLAITVNWDFDRVWLAVKQLSRDSSRALTVSLLEPEGIPPLPLKAMRALKMLAFDANGDPITSNLTLAQLEEQPALSLESAQAAAASALAALNSKNAAHDSELAAALSAVAALAAQRVCEALAGDPWAVQPIGVPIPVWDVISQLIPATNKFYRYIKLTTGDAYNAGIFSSDTSTGAAPLVSATATINVGAAFGPLNGVTVRMINTERRFIRAGSVGVVEQDAFQGHRMAALSGGAFVVNNAGPAYGSASTGASTAVSTGDPVTDTANGTPRTANETRSKNIGMTYYMRIW